MFEKLEIMRTAGAMARHAAQRQSVIAQNVANADTPGFRARELSAFQPEERSGTGLTQTRHGHLGASTRTPVARVVLDSQAALSPNGNSVSLESEMFKSIEAERHHSRAMTIYKSSLDILRASLGRR